MIVLVLTMVFIGICEEAGKNVHLWRYSTGRADEDPSELPVQSHHEHDLLVQSECNVIPIRTLLIAVTGWRYLYRSSRSYLLDPNLVAFRFPTSGGPASRYDSTLLVP